MATTLGSSDSPPGPAVTRLPPGVLKLIFSHNCDHPKVPKFEDEFVRYNLWGRKRGWAFLSVASRVCQAWTEPAQALLVKAVGLGQIAKVETAATSSLLDKYSVETLAIAARGKGPGKITGLQADGVLRKVHGVTGLLLRSMTGLTTNSIFIPELVRNLTYLDIQAPVHLPPKKTKVLVCPGSIPLKTLILGSDAQPATFLTQLFTAAAPTLVRLDLYISKTSTPTLIEAFPSIASSIRELSIDLASSVSPFTWQYTRTDHSAFIALLGLCTRVRWLGWEDQDFGRLRAVLHKLPEGGARIEAISLGYIGHGQRKDLLGELLERPSLSGLRTVVVRNGWGLTEEMKRACCARRIQVRMAAEDE